MQDPTLTQEQRELQSLVRDFADAELVSASEKYEKAGEDPEEFYLKLADLGLTGIPFDVDYGGGGQPYLTYLLALEELARVWVSLAVGLSVHTLTCDGISRYGTKDLKGRVFEELLAGRKFGAYALTEPTSGSDAASLRTKAIKDGDTYVINGQKQFCTRGGEADCVLVAARTGTEGPAGISAFIVEKGTPGFSATRTEDKMGWRASPTWELLFEDCRIPAANRLGEEGEGFKVALSALDAGRLGMAACATGLAQGAIDAALAFAAERQQFGKRISDFQGIQWMLADMATSTEAGRHLYRHAASLKDSGTDYSKQAAMAKLFCSDSAMQVTIDAVQIHGGYGYIQDYPAERYMRDAKALQIVEGTNQIQRLVIGRHLTAR